MRILITGATGKLGTALCSRLINDGHDVIKTGRTAQAGAQLLDVADFASVQQVVTASEPDMVIHTAALTDVDGCAREPEQAIAINGLGTQNLAIATHALKIPLVYISTNEVFDGTLRRPYHEYDRTNPINPYGYSKWFGEQAILSLNPRHYIVRTSWVFAHGGRNFIHAILDAANAGKMLRVVTNEVAHPTYNDDLSDAIAALINTGRFGIYHLVNAGACSRYHFARYFLNQAGFSSVGIVPITRYEWPRPSLPPEYTALENSAGKQIGIRLRPWQEAVDAYLQHEGLVIG